MQILIVMLMLIDVLAIITAGWAIKALVNILDKDEKPIFPEESTEEDDELTQRYVKSIEGIMSYDPYR